MKTLWKFGNWAHLPLALIVALCLHIVGREKASVGAAATNQQMYKLLQTQPPYGMAHCSGRKSKSFYLFNLKAHMLSHPFKIQICFCASLLWKVLYSTLLPGRTHCVCIINPLLSIVQWGHSVRTQCRSNQYPQEEEVIPEEEKQIP